MNPCPRRGQAKEESEGLSLQGNRREAQPRAQELLEAATAPWAGGVRGRGRVRFQTWDLGATGRTGATVGGPQRPGLQPGGKHSHCRDTTPSREWGEAGAA